MGYGAVRYREYGSIWIYDRAIWVMELTNFIEPFFFASLKITGETMSKQKKKEEGQTRGPHGQDGGSDYMKTHRRTESKNRFMVIPDFINFIHFGLLHMDIMYVCVCVFVSECLFFYCASCIRFWAQFTRWIGVLRIQSLYSGTQIEANVADREQKTDDKAQINLMDKMSNKQLYECVNILFVAERLRMAASRKLKGAMGCLAIFTPSPHRIPSFHQLCAILN